MPMTADSRSAIDQLEARVIALLDGIETAASGVGNVDAYLVSRARDNLRVGFVLLRVAVGDLRKPPQQSSIREPDGERKAVSFGVTHTPSAGVTL